MDFEYIFKVCRHQCLLCVILFPVLFLSCGSNRLTQSVRSSILSGSSRVVSSTPTQGRTSPGPCGVRVSTPGVETPPSTVSAVHSTSLDLGVSSTPRDRCRGTPDSSTSPPCRGPRLRLSPGTREGDGSPTSRGFPGGSGPWVPVWWTGSTGPEGLFRYRSCPSVRPEPRSCPHLPGRSVRRRRDGRPDQRDIKTKTVV